MNKHKDILKVEFKDALTHFKRDRELFHIYRINRLLTNGSIISFDYTYLPCDDPDKVKCRIDLKDFGVIDFEIDINTSYGVITTKNYSQIIDKFIDNFDVYSDSTYH